MRKASLTWDYISTSSVQSYDMSTHCIIFKQLDAHPFIKYYQEDLERFELETHVLKKSYSFNRLETRLLHIFYYSVNYKFKIQFQCFMWNILRDLQRMLLFIKNTRIKLCSRYQHTDSAIFIDVSEKSDCSPMSLYESNKIIIFIGRISFKLNLIGIDQ